MSETDRTKGTYVLLVDVERSRTIEVGALGTMEFPAGTYAYVGSALGTGGFERVERHAEIARSERDTRHWHIDYLLGSPATRLESAVLYPGTEHECELARSLPGDRRRAFGASDCDCPGHLLAVPSASELIEAARVTGGRLEPCSGTGIGGK